MIGRAAADVLDPRESAAFIDGNHLRDMCADPGASHVRRRSRCVAEPASAALTRWFSVGRQASGRGLQGCPSVRRSCPHQAPDAGVSAVEPLPAPLRPCLTTCRRRARSPARATGCTFWSKACRRAKDAELAALIAAGHGDVPLVQMK